MSRLRFSRRRRRYASAESAAGSYPVEAVVTMTKIAEEVERDSYYRSIIMRNALLPSDDADAIAIAVAARYFAETLGF